MLNWLRRLIIRRINIFAVEVEFRPPDEPQPVNQPYNHTLDGSNLPEPTTSPYVASSAATKKEVQGASASQVYTANQRFIGNGDNTVTDLKHKLMWVKTPGRLGEGIGEFGVPSEVDWATANRACEELSFAGYSDWRLPTVPEWEGLCDDIPNFNPEEFLDECRNNWYWTSAESKQKPREHFAVVIGFKKFSRSGPWGGSTKWHVRPVRGAR